MEPAEPMPVFEPLSPGDPTTIGGYRILARVGAGGMGRVYLGATQSGRRLAVKVVRPEFADDPEFRRRFRQEVTAAQRVQSLYTAPVIDAELDGPRPWMATAYVPGPSLSQVVAEEGALPTETVRPMAAGVAEALEAIHRAGVIHRDLKPSNVLLAPDGPRVIDFGIARAADATPLTRTGVRIGTPHFMAPEQALGESATPAVDVFAFGVLVFFAATGRSPFGDGPDPAVLYRIAREEPRLDGCPADLLPLVERCLVKSPDARPALRDLVNELNPEGSAPEPGWLPPEVTRRLDSYATIPLLAEAPAEPSAEPAEDAATPPPTGTPQPVAGLAETAPPGPQSTDPVAPTVRRPTTPDGSGATPSPPGPAHQQPPAPGPLAAGPPPGTPGHAHQQPPAPSPLAAGPPPGAPGHAHQQAATPGPLAAGPPPGAPGHAHQQPPAPGPLAAGLPGAARAADGPGTQPLPGAPGHVPVGPPLRQPPPPGGSPYPWAGATPGQGRGESKVNRVLAYALASTTALMVLLLVAVAALIRANDSDDPGVPGRTQQPGAQSSVAGPPPGPAVSETPAATGGTPLPGATPPGTLLKEYKGINLTSGYTIDFLGDAEHPREGYDGDLRYSSDSITADRLAVLDPGQPGTYEACRDNTRYTETLHEGEGYERGGRFCAFTDHGLVALVKVTGAQDDPSDYITIDLTIWQGAPTVSPSPTE